MQTEIQALILTLKLASISTFILTFIGVPIAYWLAFSRKRIKPLIEAAVNLPFVLPSTVLGFYLLVLLGPRGPAGVFFERFFHTQLVFSFPGIVIGSVIYSLPFMINPVKSALQNFPLILVDAARSLGKSEMPILGRVILPNIKPQLLAGLIMSFAHIIGEFGVVLMIGGSIPGQTKVASIAVYGASEALNHKSANFMSLILLALSFFMLLAVQLLNRPAARNN